MIRYLAPLIWEDIESESLESFPFAGVRDSKAMDTMAEYGASHGINAIDIEADKSTVSFWFERFFKHVGDAL